LTSETFIAGINSTSIIIITIDLSVNTSSITGVIGASIIIVTNNRRCHTTFYRITGVYSTCIVIVANNFGIRTGSSGFIASICGASAVIITVNWNKLTGLSCFVTRINSAKVIVIAHNRSVGDSRKRVASFIGTKIGIKKRNRSVNTT
jgi:hypothetical protein